MEQQSLSRRWLPGIFAVVVVSFVGATGIVHWQLSAIDRTALDIADASAPSIEHLAGARGEMRHLDALLRDKSERTARGERVNASALAASQRDLDRAVDAYLAQPVTPAEREQWAAVLRDKGALDVAVARFEAESARGDLGALAFTLNKTLPTALGNLNDSITRTMEAEAMQVQTLALRIRDLRTRSTYAALVLDIVCTFIAFAGAIVLRKTLREYAALIEGNRRLHEERESALDEFACRVAHDILSPLGTVGFALQSARSAREEQQRQRSLDRGLAALRRVKSLVNGLLEFARAGGRPSANARADVTSTIAELVAELEPLAAESGATLTATHAGTCVVTCSPGVLTSLVANLAHNAIKYLGDGPVRRVEIRALERERYVRFEVEDSGPGLAPDIEKRVFEPYVRAPNATQPGVGLGLATVKRLAEAHGGAVGVESRSGQGSTFWFEIPKAEQSAEASAPSRHGSVAAAV